MRKQCDPGLVLITDRLVCSRPLPEVVKLAVEGGVNSVQLRESGLSSRELFELASELRSITCCSGVNFIINDRVDVAIAVGADGVHVGKGSMPLNIVRGVVGDEMWIGYSAHSFKEAVKAEKSGADYVSFSPLFISASKGDVLKQSPVGVSALREVKDLVGIPVIGLGGIDEGNIDEVLENGADGVAVISAILKSKDPFKSALTLRERLKVAFDRFDKKI